MNDQKYFVIFRSGIHFLACYMETEKNFPDLIFRHTFS